MFSFTSFKRRTKVRIAKTIRGISYGIGIMKNPKTPQDLLILKIVKSMLENNDNRVMISPSYPRIYLYTKDRSVTVIYDMYNIRISNHKFFFTSALREGVGEEIIKLAKERIEKDLMRVENTIYDNEKNFLQNVYSNLEENSNKSE